MSNRDRSEYLCYNGWSCEWVHSLPVPAWWRHQMVTFFALVALCAGNHRSPVIPPQRPVTRSLDVLFVCAWVNGWVNNRCAGDLRRHHAHYDVTVIGWQGRPFANYNGSYWHILPRTIVDKSKRVVQREWLGSGAEIVVVGNGAEIVTGGLGKTMQLCHYAK